MVETESNNKFAGTYRKLFDTIERGTDQCSTDRLQTILEEKRSHFKLGLDIFTPPSSQSRSKLTTSVVVNGKSIAFNAKEKEIVLKVSDLTHLNEVQCVSLWDAYRQENKIKISDLEPDASDDTELVMDMVRFYYEDRISFLNCISSLQRIAFVKEHAFHKIAADITHTLFEDTTQNIPFICRLFTQFSTLVRSQVSTRHASYLGWHADWAKQNLKEQKALLEIVFLFSITTTYSPTFILSMLQEFEANNFGTLQAFSYVLDNEGSRIRDQITGLCQLITISIIIAPYLTLNIQLDEQCQDATLIDTPHIIAQINQLVLHMGDEPQHAVLLLSWSYFLSCLRNATQESNEPGYAQVRLILEGKQPISTDVFVDRSFAHTAGLDVPEERTLQIQQTDHLERTLIGRALKLSVFDTVQTIVDSELCSEDDVNNVGYRTVLRLLLKSFLSTTLPHYLPEDSYSELITAFSAVYRNQSELCNAFWKQDMDENGHHTLIDTALRRFPVQFSHLTELLSSLVLIDETGLDGSPSEKVFAFLCQLPSITVVLNDESFTTALVENNVAVARTQKVMRITPSLDYMNGVSLSENTQGIFLSSAQESSIVYFSKPFSGWHLLISVLANSMKELDQSNVDVQDDDLTLHGGNPESILIILHLIHRVLSNHPNLVPLLVEHIQTQAAVPCKAYNTPILISVLCDVLTFSSTVRPCPIPIATAAIKCIHVLLPHYPKAIWSYLRTSPMVPHNTTNKASSTTRSRIRQIVAHIECPSGTYDLLLSFLDLVQGLVRDIQTHWRARETDADYVMPEAQAQIDTLYTCLHYLMLDVFPVYSGWRYKRLSDRYLLSTKMISVFIEVCNYFKERPMKTQPSLRGIRDGLYKNFLYNDVSRHVSPLLDMISEGADVANVLYGSSHIKEAQLVEESVALSLGFVKLLLQQRLEDIDHGIETSSLEQFIFERPVHGGNCSDFLLRIAKHIEYRHSILLPIQATHVLSLLCQTTNGWESTPNFIQHLGDMTEAHAVIRTYLSSAKDTSQSEILLSAIWQFITTLLETQPGLAILFLDCGDFIMPSPKSAVRLQTETNVTVDSAMRAAVDILQTWETLLLEKPTVISNVLRFLSTFWKTAFDHYGLVERTRSDSALWDVLGKILLNTPLEHQPSQELENTNLLEIDFAQEDRFDLSVRRLCCANLSKAFAMQIMAYEIHLTAGNERVKKSKDTAEAIPVGLKSLLTKISEPTKLSTLSNQFVKNDFNPELFKTANHLSQLVLQHIGIQDPLALLFESTAFGSGDDGVAGEVRQYGDSYLYDLRMTTSRVFSFYSGLRDKYNLTQQNLIVTPEINAALDIQRLCSEFIKHLVKANHNFSIVDSQIILLQSFKRFIETSSHHVNSLIWVSKPSQSGCDNLANFIRELIRQAKNENRSDGVTLTSYTALVYIVRSLIEDWIEKSKNALLGKGTAGSEEYAMRVSQMLHSLSELLSGENFTMMQSLLDSTAITFHQPLLESILLCIYALRGSIQRIPSSAKQNLTLCLNVTLPQICASLHVLTMKAQSLSPQDQAINEDAMNNCITDVTIVCSLLQEICNEKYGMTWDYLAIQFETHHTFTSLFKLLYGGIELITHEIKRQTAASDRLYSLQITPFAEAALHLLQALSNIPGIAKMLVENQFFDTLTNNSLTAYLQQGALEQFIRFGDKTKRDLDYVERNPLHSIWCQILNVVSSLLRTNGDMEIVLRNTVNLLQICGPQIGRTYEKANSLNESLFALVPLECLSTPMLEELEAINTVFFGLSKHIEQLPRLAGNLFTSFKDCSLLLLQRYLYFLTHPSHMKAQLYRIDQQETVDEFMKNINRLILSVTHRMLTTLILLTHADYVFVAPDVEWHFGNTIFYPDMRDTTDTSASFGTLIEYINTSMAIVGQWEVNNEKDEPLKEALDVIQSCALILTSQVALWVAKPDITSDDRTGIAVENVMDIAEVLSNATFALEKLIDKKAVEDIVSRVKLMNMMQTFLNKRFFE
ncbi:hypothetical protein BY458DRAFT_554388 [Sporodiniella umbellata]|nr:hypothetical protein BY458DRAFT_554388 [Sporodiniella umbellata]